MADFLSDFGGSLGDKVLPNGDALNRKIDGQREKFLKGISSTKYGKKEDPTYLHFRFIFDFGDTSEMDPETFLAPSPLFRSATRDSNRNIANIDAAADAANVVLVLTSIQDLSDVFIFVLTGLKYKQNVPKPAEFDNFTVVGYKEDPKAEL